MATCNARQVSEGVINLNGDYNELFHALKEIMESNGGTIRRDDIDAGILEGAWKYGLNMFGLRVTARFNVLKSGEMQVAIKGGFKDALDTTGAGKKKSQEITAKFLSIFPEQEGLTIPAGTSTPPPKSDALEDGLGKSKVAAGLFGIFLGGIGIHKFYLGCWGWGVLYILMCWTMITQVVGFIPNSASKHFSKE
jgi:hypothetical protein